MGCQLVREQSRTQSSSRGAADGGGRSTGDFGTRFLMAGSLGGALTNVRAIFQLIILNYSRELVTYAGTVAIRMNLIG